MIKEEQVKEAIKSRTRAKKIQLYVARFILFTIFLGMVGGGWVSIYLVNVNSVLIETYLKSKFTWLSYVAAFVPPLCLTAINIILPFMTKILINLERWDYQSTIINN